METYEVILSKISDIKEDIKTLTTILTGVKGDNGLVGTVSKLAEHMRSLQNEVTEHKKLAQYRMEKHVDSHWKTITLTVSLCGLLMAAQTVILAVLKIKGVV